MRAKKQKGLVQRSQTIQSVRGLAGDIIIEGRKIDRHSLKKAMTSMMGSRRILSYNPKIQEKNPDRIFRWINIQDYRNNGGHQYGYEPYIETDPELRGNSSLKSKNFLDTNSDSSQYVIRNNMVLASIPREEYENRILRELALNSTSEIAKAYKASMPRGMREGATLEEGADVEVINAADINFGPQG